MTASANRTPRGLPDEAVMGKLSHWVTDEELVLAAELSDLDHSRRGSTWSYDADLDEPPAWEVTLLSDDDLVLGLDGPADPSDLLLLASIDPASLTSQRARLAYVRAVDRVAAHAASLRHRAEVALVGECAGTEFLPEVHKAHELSIARRTSRHAASQEISVARRLATVFPRFAVALHDGEVSEAHCATLVSRTRHVSDPDVLARIEAQVLPSARRVPTAQFATEVAAAVSVLDADATARVRRARATRGVHARQLDDGMGRLTVTHEWSTIRALVATNDADARALQLARGGAEAISAGDTDATMDACRADAFASRTLGTVHGDGSVTWDRDSVQVVVNVVMDLDTLREEADRVALVDGQPVPAAIARQTAEAATWWRRKVTDTVDGHLLDYGRATYLPARLRRFVLARDGGCRTPMCATAASTNLQMDHADEFPDSPSDSRNCGGLCPICHQLKTHGFADITGSRPDGSCTWTTPVGPGRPRPTATGPPDRPGPDAAALMLIDRTYPGSVITGAHLMLFSTDPDADREFLRTVLGWPYVHAAGPDDPWLIFRLPPGEVGVHPTDADPSTALYLTCDDLDVTIAALAAHGVAFTGEPQNQGWGTVTGFRLPGGAEIGLYQPRHSTAHDA